MTTPPTPPTDNLAAEGGPRSEMSEREALAAEIEEVLRENMSRGTSGRYIVSYGITPEDFADALADLLAARDRRVRGEAWDEGHRLGEALAYNAVGDILWTRHDDVIGRSDYRAARAARAELLPHWDANPYREAAE